MDPAKLHTALQAAQKFVRWGSFHRDTPRPEQMEKALRELREALDRLEGKD